MTRAEAPSPKFTSLTLANFDPPTGGGCCPEVDMATTQDRK